MKIVVILLALFMSGKAAADVYRCTDTDGRIYYTDESRNSLCKRIKTKAMTYIHITIAPSPVRACTGTNKKLGVKR